MVQNGLDGDPVGALRTTVSQITDVAEEVGATEPFKLTVCFSDGKRLYACRHSSQGHPPSLYWQMRHGSILVASEPNDCDKSPWNQVAADAVLTIGDEVSFERLYPASDAAPQCRIMRLRESVAA